jgi:hypothetical protein
MFHEYEGRFTSMKDDRYGHTLASMDLRDMQWFNDSLVRSDLNYSSDFYN